MRILAITNLFPNPLQPSKAPFNRQQLSWLSRRHEVSVIAPILWNEERRARRASGEVLQSDRTSECDGMEVHHPRYIYPPKILRGLYGHCFDWSIRPTFERVFARFRPEILFAPWAYPDGWAAVELGRRKGLPVVVKVHGSDVNALDAHRSRRGPTIATLRRADLVIAVSQHLADRMVELGVPSSRIRVVYDGVDTERFRPGSRDEARHRLGLSGGKDLLLFVGNLVQVKGLDVLLAACDDLARAEVPFRIHLVGDGPLRSWVEREAQRLSLGDRVFLAGARPHDEIADWFRAADLLVLPSRSEGVPSVLLEAASCGLPFVATRVGGIPEIAHLGTGRLVRSGDADALAAAIADGLSGSFEHPATSKPRGQDEVAAELSEIFEAVVSNARGPSATAAPLIA